MLLTQQCLLLHLVATCHLSVSQRVLEVAPDAALHVPALPELFEAMVPDHEGLRKRGAVPYPRDRRDASPPRDRLYANSSPAMAKRALLASRQSYTCDAGYSLCEKSNRCCPDSDGSGRCCNDGTCVTTSDTCCTGGLACGAGKDCCVYSCKPKENSCCNDGSSCDPGYKCCGYRNCAPKDGECCSDGTSCKKGLRCVILNGIRGCCKDLSCSEFDTDDTTSYTYKSVTIPSITLPSLTIPTDTYSIPSITIPTPDPSLTGVANYRYYTTYITWYYYSFFITTRTPTSTRVTTSTTISIYASASAQASSIFVSLSSEIAILTSVTAPGYTSATGALGTGDTSLSAGAAGATFSGGESTGPISDDSSSAGVRRAEGRWIAWVMVAVGFLFGVGMIFL